MKVQDGYQPSEEEKNKINEFVTYLEEHGYEGIMMISKEAENVTDTSTENSSQLSLAAHFYNLGINARQKGKEADLEQYVNERVAEIFPEQDNDFLSQEDLRKVVRKTARHFYNLGLNSKK